MFVKQLIEILKRMDPEASVVLCHDDDNSPLWSDIDVTQDFPNAPLVQISPCGSICDYAHIVAVEDDTRQNREVYYLQQLNSVEQLDIAIEVKRINKDDLVTKQHCEVIWHKDQKVEPGVALDERFFYSCPDAINWFLNCINQKDHELVIEDYLLLSDYI